MPNHPTWSALMAEHHRYMTARNLAPTTIRLYRYMLLGLAERHPRPHLITEAHLIGMLANHSWGPDGKRSARSAYRSFFRWAFRAGHLPTDPSYDLPAIQRRRRSPRPTPEPVLDTSLREAQPREQFMLELAAFGGLRCCEIAVVHGARDWDTSRHRLLVHGKGDKERVVPITDEQLLGRLDALDGWAFPNRTTGRPMTPGHVSVLLSRALHGTWTGHTLRHRFGTEALEHTKDLAAVAEVMGHEQVETTRLYAKVSDDRLVAVSRAARRRHLAA